MSKPPEDIRPESWHRFYAIEGNNRAWTLAEQRTSDAGDAELLDAAHASAWHWNAVGTELQRMRAKMLLANVHALAGHGRTALAYATDVRNYFVGRAETPDWELAFAHTIYAHAAHAAGETEAYAQAYHAATVSVAAVADAEDRAIVLRTFRQVPVL